MQEVFNKSLLVGGTQAEKGRMTSEPSFPVLLGFAAPFLHPAPSQSGGGERQCQQHCLNITLQNAFLFNLTFTPALLAQSKVSLGEAGCAEARVGREEKKNWRVGTDSS